MTASGDMSSVGAATAGAVATIDAVQVVIPVRNEERLLPACLDAVDVALSHLRTERPGIGASVCVVLDSCTDRSAAIVEARPSLRCVAIETRSAGAARRRGVADVIRSIPRTRWSTTWVANTDADTVVPAHWLTAQVALAETGLQLVVGTVEPDAADLDASVLAEWRRRHALGEAHPHVHGANLGFRLDAYVAVGGYRSLRVHEDVALVSAMRTAGLRWCATDTTRVLTSGRQIGRAPAGFGQYLHRLSSAASLGTVTASDA